MVSGFGFSVFSSCALTGMYAQSKVPMPSQAGEPARAIQQSTVPVQAVLAPAQPAGANPPSGQNSQSQGTQPAQDGISKQLSAFVYRATDGAHARTFG